MSFSLTRKTDYALLALAELSRPEQLTKPGRSAGTVSARAIADTYQLPLPLLTNVLKDLATAGLIDSRRGAGGGYYLARPAALITLAQVVAAIEGPVALARCCSPDSPTPAASSQPSAGAGGDACPACKQTPRCPITHSMHRFNDAITLAMHQLTLAQMMQEDLKIVLSIQPAAPRSRESHPTGSPVRSLSLAQTA